MEKIVWKTIPNYSGYEASSLGDVRSLNYKRTGRKQILKPSDAGNQGYLKTMLKRDDGRYISRPIHRLVAYAFHGEYPELTVDHVDGNKKNNRADNLEWVTRSENVKRGFDLGLQKPKRGELNGMSKLTPDQVRAARKQKAEGGMFWGRRKLALELGISEKHLQKIVNNPDKTWQDA